MLNIIISLLTFVLILISLFLVLVILMQRANTNAGMGSAFGGGVAESAFGAETTNVLVRATKWSAGAFFVIALLLFLLYLHRATLEQKAAGDELPDIPVAEVTIPEQPVAETGSVDVQQVIQETAENAQDAVDAFTGQPVQQDQEQAAESPPQP